MIRAGATKPRFRSLRSNDRGVAQELDGATVAILGLHAALPQSPMGRKSFVRHVTFLFIFADQNNGKISQDPSGRAAPI